MRVTACPRLHVGLGTKTALLLAALAAIDAVLDCGFSREDMIGLAGRGGASGVGVNAFFTGGYVLDGGHPNAAVPTYLPSALRPTATPPPILSRLDIPPAWRFLLILPPGARLHGESERRMFLDETPLSAWETHEAACLHLLGVAAAVATNDLDSLGTALARLQEIGFKKREIRRQASTVPSVLRLCRSMEIAAGMSSLGPLVYAVGSESDTTRLKALADAATRSGNRILGIFRGSNGGTYTTAGGVDAG